MGNGAVFQLVPQRFPERIGLVTGIVGAAGGLGGFFLPSVLGAVSDYYGTYTPGLVLLHDRLRRRNLRAARARQPLVQALERDGSQTDGCVFLSWSAGSAGDGSPHIRARYSCQIGDHENMSLWPRLVDRR